LKYDYLERFFGIWSIQNLAYPNDDITLLAEDLERVEGLESLETVADFERFRP
jgi:hypothetical protein